MEKESVELKEKLEEILYPKKEPEKFKITLKFKYRLADRYKKAVELAKKNPTYREKGEGEWKKHYVTYTQDEVEDLFEIFNLVHDFDDLEILVNHKKLPYAHQLWILLMWFYRI